MLNAVQLEGRLTADPELKYTSTDIAVASFNLAVDRSYIKAEKNDRQIFLKLFVGEAQQNLHRNILRRVSSLLFKDQFKQIRIPIMTEINTNRLRLLPHSFILRKAKRTVMVLHQPQIRSQNLPAAIMILHHRITMISLILTGMMIYRSE